MMTSFGGIIAGVQVAEQLAAGPFHRLIDYQDQARQATLWVAKIVSVWKKRCAVVMR
jgi:hypothetical protein